MDPKPDQVFPLKKAYPFAEQHGLADEARKIRDMEISWDRPYTSSVRRGFMLDLFRRHQLLPAFKEAHWPNGLAKSGEAEERRYLRIKSQFEAYVEGVNPRGSDQDDEEDERSEEFPREAHLRDFLAKNPDRIEPGLRLYSTPENEGVEFPVDNGRIDILAVDPHERVTLYRYHMSFSVEEVSGTVKQMP